MGELRIDVNVEIPGADQEVQIQIVLKLCANPLCTKSTTGSRRYFAPIIPRHIYCDKECKDQWTNKQRT